ncbi:MAG: arabinogalactan endo-1,4-beta-galactosidase [Bacteroidales bacterium]|nr:arabinogalactan endo-1,4-beta-galactosidase [Bacteroidales bacterium]
MKRLTNILMAGLLIFGMAACEKNNQTNNGGEDPNSGEVVNPENPDEPDEPTDSVTEFARGADVSWLTEMEADGYKFYDADGTETECMTLLQSLGMNAIRLRVWVNPSDGWCGKDDVVVKAKRAAALGMRVMIDFHYSDTWADPGKQIKPSAWASLSLDDLKTAITTHTKDVLNALKDAGVTPEWVQVGNEVRSGLLWDTDASLSGATWDATYNGVTYKTNEANFAAFITTGYDAVKAVFPDAKVIVHIDEGQTMSNYTWIYDMLKSYSASYDVIGMSLYPESSWQSTVNSCLTTVNYCISRYGKEVMLCEVGMAQSPASTAKSCLTQLITSCKAIDSCLGVFYWEPECYGGWQGYQKGAFDDTGRPTEALDAFAE